MAQDVRVLTFVVVYSKNELKMYLQRQIFIKILKYTEIANIFGMFE